MRARFTHRPPKAPAANWEMGRAHILTCDNWRIQRAWTCLDRALLLSPLKAKPAFNRITATMAMANTGVPVAHARTAGTAGTKASGCVTCVKIVPVNSTNVLSAKGE